MFPLFKIRDFGILFNETFSFFKFKGKNFFANYFKSLALLFVLMVVILYFFANFFFGSFYQNLGLMNSDNNYLESYYADHIGLILLLSGVFFILLFLVGSIQFAYPVLYLKLLENDSEKKPTFGEMKKELKENIGRALLFMFISIFFFGFFGMLILGLCILLIFVIIGIPLLFIVGPYFTALFYIMFYQYMIKKQGYLEAFSYAFKTVNSNFWPIIGSVLCILFIVQMINYVITMIPYGIMMVLLFTNGTMNDSVPDNLGVLTIILALTYCLAIIVSMLLNNVIIISCGLIYYSEREKLESRSTKNEIDLIGRLDD